jgi:penicillin amidase
VRQLWTEVFREASEALEGIDGTEALAELSSGLAFAARSTATLLDLLEQRDDAFFGDGRTWAGVVEQAFEQTAAELGERLGPDPAAWRWGDVHRLVLDHPLGRLPGVARIFRRGPFPLGGDGDTVQQAWQPPAGPHAGVRTVGPAMRFVADLGDPDGSRFVLCGGQSGHPASDAYEDHVVDWLVGRARPLAWSAAAIEADRAATLWLDPPGP